MNEEAIDSLEMPRAVLAAETMDHRETYRKGDAQYQTALDFYRLRDDVTDWTVTGWDQEGFRDRNIKESELRELSDRVDRQISSTRDELRELRTQSSLKRRHFTQDLFRHLNRHVRRLKSHQTKIAAKLERIKTGDADFPYRTQAMVDNIRRLAHWPRRRGPKVFIAGLNHLRTAHWREEDPRFDLAPLYDEMGRHKSVLLVPKVFDEHLNNPSDIGSNSDSFVSAERD